MNARNVRFLAVVVVALFVAMFILNSRDRDDPGADSELLFPELKSRLNDLNSVAITDADATITLQRESDGKAEGGRWISPDHAGYPADTGALRQLLLALAEARKLERKTSDPGLYGRLGVDDPRKDGGDGILVAANGRDVAISVILGSTAQSEFRYARIPDDEQSWLIDRNPVIPNDNAGWLSSEIVDVESSRIRSASIRHADGEVISIRKENEDAVNFEVAEIPEGRELRYPSVANSIAGVLSGLTLEAVRKDDTAGSKPLATAEFSTFDGLDIRIAVHTVTAPGEAQADESETGQDEEHWITVSAAASPTTAVAEDASEDRDAEAAPAETEVDLGNGPEGDEETMKPEEQSAENIEEDTPTDRERNPADEAGLINERVSGWTYRIPTYKADQLTRRWDDLLGDVDDGDEID